MDVIVVGAGPTGLTAALELVRHGLEPVILEKRPEPSQLSRAVGIMPRSMEILAPSGVASRIEEEAVRFGGIIFHDKRRPLARLPLNFDEHTRIWGLAQDRTETHLREALAAHGVEIRYGSEVLSVAQDEDNVTAGTTRGSVRAPWLIGADGVRSTVRPAIGVEYAGYDLPGSWSIADVYAKDWPDPTWFHGYMLPRGNVCVVVPLETARFRVIASAPDALDALPVRMDVTEVKRSGAFTISVRQARRYREGRIFLAGDAAHAHSPVGGRGMNLGIADAADLARRLSEGTADGYEAARHAEGEHVIRLSERARRVLQSRSAVARAAVPGLFRAAALFPPLGRAMMRQMVSG